MAFQVVTHSQLVFEALEAPSTPVVIGFFSETSAASRMARPAFEQYCAEHPDQAAFYVDVAAVPDLHAKLDVQSVPTVLLVRDHRVLQKVVGARTQAAYALALGQAPSRPAATRDAQAPRRGRNVLVYTTDVCPWCTRVKSYLRQRGVAFRERNVQRDESAARELAARSSNKGVPQLDIDGQLVVGFDKPRIDSLLGLPAGSATDNG